MLTINEKVDCKTDLLEFTKTIFKHNENKVFIENWHHREVCETLEQVFVGRIKRLIINIPPRYGKTELAVINFISWTMGIYPDSQFIYATYSRELSTQSAYKIRNNINSEVYKEIFPDVKLMDDSKAKYHFKTTKNGMVYAIGAGGSITGFGAGLHRDGFGGAMIIDDPHKASEANSNTKRKSVIDWYVNTMESRINKPLETPIILIMQRLHEEDLTGFLLDRDKARIKEREAKPHLVKNLKDSRSLDWQHLVIPALDKEDKPLWSFTHDFAKLDEMRKESPYVFAGQYMQNPAPLGGGLFKEEWWRYYDKLPNVEYKIITADTAQKTKESNDFSVFQCWGYDKGKIYLIKQIRGKWEAPELRANFIAFWESLVGTGIEVRGKLRQAYVEDKASGTGLIQDIKADTNIPIVPIPRHLDKVVRAYDMVPYIQSGKVFLPSEWEDLPTFISEFSSFTPNNTHKHDDQIDPALDAISILLSQTKRSSGIRALY